MYSVFIYKSYNGSIIYFITDKLQSSFKTFGFIVEMYDNQGDSEMTQKLMTVALEDHSQYNCFVCCILSYGDCNRVYGSNGVTVDIEELMEILDADRCPSLAGKPKLFFVLALKRTDIKGMTKARRDAKIWSKGELGMVCIYRSNATSVFLPKKFFFCFSDL